jgi:hypothetical protein
MLSINTHGVVHKVDGEYYFRTIPGVYGLDRLVIARAGRTEPVGIIELASVGGETKIGCGSGMLLRVVGPSK